MLQQQLRTSDFYFRAGFNAYKLGKTSFDCPFKHKTMEEKNWIAGYATAKRNRERMFIVNPIPQRKTDAELPIHARKMWAQKASQEQKGGE